VLKAKGENQALKTVVFIRDILKWYVNFSQMHSIYRPARDKKLKKEQSHEEFNQAELGFLLAVFG